jgi:nitrogen fixation protein NifB
LRTFNATEAGAMSNTAFVSIGDLKLGRPVLSPSRDSAASGGCSTSGGDGKASCGSSNGPEDMPAEIWEKVKNHPCYSEEAHHHYARMHVAVAPACNIQCNYCNRKYDCSNESRPGVVSQKLTPEQAVKKVRGRGQRDPADDGAGHRRPGRCAGQPEEDLRHLPDAAGAGPDIKLCLSTNGLALPQMVDEICKYNIDHVTITINMVDPEVGAKIYPWIFWEHRRSHRHRGRDHPASPADAGPGDAHRPRRAHQDQLGADPRHQRRAPVEVNREVKKRGAFLHNIMPLISEAEHGTVFGLNGQRGPTAQELKAVQDACMGGANLMRHCRQCRADAVGLLGEDRSEEFTLDKIEEMEVVYDLDKRRAYQQQVELTRQAQQQAKYAALGVADGR